MPASGMLFANDHEAGRTFIFDVRDPLHPKIAASFTDMAGYMHPHSYLRLPNGHVLASFQHAHHASGKGTGATGGLVEIDDHGKGRAFGQQRRSRHCPTRCSRLTASWSFRAWIASCPPTPPCIWRRIFSGVTYQVWRLSDLKLLKTSYFDVGENRYSQVGPQEPRLGARWIGLRADAELRHRTHHRIDSRPAEVATRLYFPRKLVRRAHHRRTFPDSKRRAPPTGLIVLDISNAGKPVEVSRVKLTDTYIPHWTAWDAKTQRVVVTAGLNPKAVCTCSSWNHHRRSHHGRTFRDTDGKVGFNFEDREWPHGWKGTGLPHGAVFSR